MLPMCQKIIEAGTVKRAPRWMSQVGLEWFYRLASEPQRLWKRYLLDALPFFWLVLKQKLRLYKNPWSVKSDISVKSVAEYKRTRL